VKTEGFLAAAAAALVTALSLAASATAAVPERATSGALPAGIASAPVPQKYVPRELLVRFKQGAGRNARSQVLREEHAQRKQWLPLPGLELLELADAQSVEAAIRAFEAKPDVLYAEPNFIYEALATPNDPRFSELWGLHQATDVDIDAPEAWDLTTGSPNVTVAVVDTGVAYDHPDLAPNIWSNPGELSDGIDNDGNGKIDDIRGWDFFGNGTTEDNDPRDIEGHGTHVAGTIGARGNDATGVTGVNWNVKILPVRVLGPEGGTNAAVTAGFTYAAQEGAKVVNASLGCAGCYSQAMKDAIDAQPNTLYVVAAGNDTANNDADPHYPCSYTSPNLICVAAITKTNGLATFSNYGLTSVDVGAPGTEIVSTWPAHDTYFTDGFEDPLAWTAGGDPNTWAATPLLHLDGLKSGTDSPLGVYPNFSDNWFRTTNPINLSGRIGCLAEYAMALQTEFGYDFLRIEGSTNATSWSTLGGWTGQTPNFPNSWFLFDTSLTGFDGAPAFYLRFRLDSDDIIGYDGVYLDRFSVQCISTNYDANDYNSIQGTSMATPHVAGVAALGWAIKPTATVAQVKNAIMSTGDPVAALSGKTVTGTRVNARAAVALLAAPPPPPPPPPPPDTTAPTDPVVTSPSHRVGVPSRNRQVQIRWSGASDSQSGVDGFSYQLDHSDISTPDRTKDAEENIIGINTPPLQNGRWFFHISTVDNAGNWTSARHFGPIVIAVPRAIAAVRCRVPNVRGKTVAQARRLLSRAHCRLGRTRRVYSNRMRPGRIVKQSKRPGVRLARGTRVNVDVSRGRRR